MKEQKWVKTEEKIMFVETTTKILFESSIEEWDKRLADAQKALTDFDAKKVADAKRAELEEAVISLQEVKATAEFSTVEAMRVEESIV